MVRLTGLMRVEVHEPGKRMRTALPGDMLTAPGVLKNSVPVEALYERDAAERATFTNLLQRRGYDDLDAVLAEGREEGRKEAREVAREVARKEGREEGLLRAKRDALLRVLDRRQLGITPKISAAIAACSDAAQLDAWLDSAIVASSASEVFKRRPRERR